MTLDGECEVRRMSCRKTPCEEQTDEPTAPGPGRDPSSHRRIERRHAHMTPMAPSAAKPDSAHTES